MEHRGHVAYAFVDFRTGDTEADHHESNLRDCREGENTLDVELRAGDDSRIHCRDGADDGYEHQGCLACQIKREETGNEVDTGHNHSSGMDERADRGRAFHGVGEPDVERHHCRFTHTSGEDQDKSPGQSRSAHEGCASEVSYNGAGVLGQGLEVEGLAVERQNQNTDKEAEVGEAGDDKRLLRGRNGCRTLIVESDKEV